MLPTSHDPTFRPTRLRKTLCALRPPIQCEPPTPRLHLMRRSRFHPRKPHCTPQNLHPVAPLRSLLCEPLQTRLCAPLRACLCDPRRSRLCAPLRERLCEIFLHHFAKMKPLYETHRISLCRIHPPGQCEINWAPIPPTRWTKLHLQIRNGFPITPPRSRYEAPGSGPRQSQRHPFRAITRRNAPSIPLRDLARRHSVFLTQELSAPYIPNNG